MRTRLEQFLRLFGGILLGSVFDRIEGLERRLDDLRAQSGQVESKVDYLISLVGSLQEQVAALREQAEADRQERSAQVAGLKLELDLHARRTEHLAENDEAVMQGEICIVEHLQRIESLCRQHLDQTSRSVG
jgi:hypothetical protein